MTTHLRTLGLALAAALLALPASAQLTEVTDAAGLTTTYMPSDPTGNDQLDAMFGGASVADFDDDGWDDIFWLGGELGVNKLFANEGDGTFTDVAASAGVDDTMPGGSGQWGDVDEDGDLDLFVTTYDDYSFRGEPVGHRNVLYVNDGDGTFTEDGVAWGIVDSGKWGASFGDLDLDGDLDLVTTTWGADVFGFGTSTLIYENTGSTFVDVTPANVVGDPTYAFSPTIADYDADGDNDILHSGDFVTTRIYRNDGAFTFTNVSDAAGPFTGDNPMGSRLADVNGDGWMDWFISSTFVPDELLPKSWAPKTGNRLYVNDGDGTFTDMTDVYGVRDGGWGWGADICDLDNNGKQEIVHTNGFFVSGFPELQPLIQDDETRVFQGVATLPMPQIAPFLGANNTDQGRGLVLFDYDRDGLVDLLQSSFDNGLRLYRNDKAVVGTWLEVSLQGTQSNSRGVGARIVVEGPAEGALAPQYRWILAGNNYLSQSPMVAWFGLAGETSVDVTVEWQSGEVTVLEGVAANQELTITEPGGTWTNLGSGLAGDGGLVPLLEGTGELSDGSANSLELSGARPSSTAHLFVGLTQLDAPFKGGTLVPSPVIAPVSLPTSPSGTLSLPFVWPAGVPAGTELYFQHWVDDPAGPKGLSASNGLLGVTAGP